MVQGDAKPGLWGAEPQRFPAAAWPELSGQPICYRASLQKMNHYKSWKGFLIKERK